MADAAQSLSEFTASLLSDLGSGAITAQEAVSAAQQYPYLREELASQDALLSESLVESDDAFTATLTNILLRIQTKLTELPNFQSQQPDKPMEEKEIRDTASLRAHAIHRVKETLHPTTGKANTRRAFIHDLVTKYGAFVPGIDEKTIETAVDKSLISASKENSPTRIGERFPELLTASLDATGITLPKDQTDTIRASVAATVRVNETYISDAAQRYQREERIFSALFDTLDRTRPDVFVDIALNAPSSEPIGDTLLRADRLARAAHLLETTKGVRGGRLTFFSADGARGIAGGLQKGADGILSIVGEPVRDMILHEKVNGTLRSMLTNTQHFADRLGENFVHSALFAHITQDLTKQLADRPRGGAARSLFDDVFSSVFRGPLDPMLQKNAEGRILDFFELSRANAAAPKNKRFLPPGTLPWDVFRTPADMVGGYGISARRGFPWFPALGFGFFGNALGNLFSSIIDRTTAFLFSSPRIPGQLSSSRRAAAIPTILRDDMPLMVALTVVIVILLLFILPTPFNVSQISHSSKVSALFASLKKTTGTETGGSIGSIGPATLTCANISGAHLFQNDPSWSNVNCSAARPDVPACRAPTACTIGASGCGSTSAAMILNSFGSKTNVPTVWNTQHKNGGYAYYNQSCASYWSGPIGILQSAGLSVFQISLQEAEKILKECGLLLAFVDEKWSTGNPTGHIIVITGISSGSGVVKVTTMDPMRPPGYVSTVTDNPRNPGDIHIRGLFGVVK